jgi:two-component system, OmpR family, heavy metal sensor histidine kinase CusS
MNLWMPAAFLLGTALALMMERNRRTRLRDRARIGALEERIEALKLELSEMERHKSDLLSRIGNSLRKPLESVRSTAEELTRPFDSSPGVKEQLNRLASEIGEIGNFLEVIREIAFLEKMDRTSGSPFLTGSEASSVQLDGLIMDSLNEWNYRFSDSGVSLAVSMDEDIRITGSHRYLKQALDNILSEVSRPMSPGGLIHVVLSGEGGTARMTVEYTGEHTVREVQSALGVELARQIVNAHDGWLTCDPDAGRYAVEFPLASSRESGS